MEYQLGNTAESRRRFEHGLEACPTYTRLYYAYADMEASMVSWFIPIKLVPSSFRPKYNMLYRILNSLSTCSP